MWEKMDHSFDCYYPLSSSTMSGYSLHNQSHSSQRTTLLWPDFDQHYLTAFEGWMEVVTEDRLAYADVEHCLLAVPMTYCATVQGCFAAQK